MWQYIKLLLASWLNKVLFLLAIASAIGTYLPGLSLPPWIPLALLVVALVIAPYSVYKSLQHRIEAHEARLSEPEDYAEWSKKHDQVVDALEKIHPGFITTGRSSSSGAYGLIFQDENLRRRIERQLGRPKGLRYRFEPYRLSKEELLNQPMRELIDEVVHIVETFKRKHPDWARQIKLLPPQ